MDKFLDYIEKYKLAIFGTIIIHIMVFFFSIFTTVKDVNRMASPVVSLEVPLDDVELEEEDISESTDEENPNFSGEVSNSISNENDERDRSYEDYSTNSEEAKLSAKELEAQYFKEAAENNERSEYAEEMEEHQVKEKVKTKSNTTSGGANAFAGEVMISYNLKGRDAYDLQNPGYTCNGSGVVVIKIKVDKSGKVKDATYDTVASKRATTCMVERALLYAKKSRFNYKSTTGVQAGTITYKFMGK